MIITLSNNKQIEILGINLRNSTIDFRWLNEVYNGECSFPFSTVGIPDAEDIEVAANAELVTEVQV